MHHVRHMHPCTQTWISSDVTKSSTERIRFAEPIINGLARAGPVKNIPEVEVSGLSTINLPIKIACFVKTNSI